MKYNHRLKIAARFSVSSPDILESWIITLNYIRNVIAHHARLWNSNITECPRFPRIGDITDFDVIPMLPIHPPPETRLYSICCILSYLTHVINPQSKWIEGFKSEIKSFPRMPHATIRAMGFPQDWETHGFWNY